MKVRDFMHEMAATSAVFGRTSGAYVTFEGDSAYTDGKRINLPSLALDKKLTLDQVLVMRGYVDHEAGHLRHSDMPRIMDFYGRCLSNGKESLKIIHNCVEDVWMEGKVCDDYYGAYKNLRATNELVKTREARSRRECEEFIKTGDINVFTEMDPEMKSKLQSNPRAVTEWRGKLQKDLDGFNAGNVGAAIKGYNPMYYDGRGAAQEFLDMLPEKVHKFAPMWAKMASECGNSEECITLAKSIHKLLEEDPELESNPEDFDPTSGEGMDEGELSPEYDPNHGDKKGECKEGRMSKNMEEGEGDGYATSRLLPKDYMPKANETMTSSPASEDGSGGIGGMDGPLKGGYRVYTTSDDVVYAKAGGRNMEIGSDYVNDIVKGTCPIEYEKVRAETSGEINTMKSRLKRALLSKDKRDWDFGREQGRLDSRRLTSAVLGNPYVYKTRMDREEENTVVTFLVDLSGSMGGRKVHVARDCAVALSECMAGSNMTFKVVGFSNNDMPRSIRGRMGGGGFHRYERTDTVIFKDFEQPLRTARYAISHIHEAVGGNNSDFDFIQAELAHLKARPERRKVLFVLSDGHPSCCSDASTNEHIRHCRDAIKESSRDGIECVGVGICDSSVRKIYDDCVVVNNVSDLAGSCFTKLTKLLIG